METTFKISVKWGTVTQVVFCNQPLGYINSEEFKKIASIMEDACNEIKAVINEKPAPQSEEERQKP